MHFYVGIDLAERHSAAVVLDHNLAPLIETYIDAGKVEKQEHPWQRFRDYRKWTTDLLDRLNAVAWDEAALSCFYAIEEPYPHAVNVAPAYRMQGAVIAELQDHHVAEDRVRITKSKPWQDHFGYTKREFGNAKAWAKLMCEGFEYEPGATCEEKVKAKPKEDLRDAYLMARWLKETLDSDALSA